MDFLKEKEKTIGGLIVLFGVLLLFFLINFILSIGELNNGKVDAQSFVIFLGGIIVAVLVIMFGKLTYNEDIFD